MSVRGWKVNQERVRAIEDCLLRAISGDLTARAEVSDELDEVDGIATGVNILIGGGISAS